MGTLLDTYKAIQETEAEKVAEEVTEEVVDEGQETLRKYAEGAEGLLAAEYGEEQEKLKKITSRTYSMLALQDNWYLKILREK